MKIKSQYVLRKVLNNWMVLPVGEDTKENTLLKLNDSGAMLWKMLEQGCERQALVDYLMENYAVSDQQAASDVDAFLSMLKQTDCLEEKDEEL